MDSPYQKKIKAVLINFNLTDVFQVMYVLGPPLVILQAIVAGSPSFTVTSPDLGIGTTSSLTVRLSGLNSSLTNNLNSMPYL